MGKETKHPSKVKKVHEVEQELKSDGYFVFRSTQPHRMFHVVAMSQGHILMVQVLRLFKFNFNDVNKELCKVQDFIASGRAPQEKMFYELWVWVNNKGWVKYSFEPDGSFTKFEDYGTNDFRKKLTPAQKLQKHLDEHGEEYYSKIVEKNKTGEEVIR